MSDEHGNGGGQQRKSPVYVSAGDRGRALDMLSHGQSFEEVASNFNVTTETVRRWHRENNEVGPAYREREMKQLQQEAASMQSENEALHRRVERLERLCRHLFEQVVGPPTAPKEER